MCTQGTFAKDYELRDQIQRAGESIMHNIAEGFDGGSNAEFVKFIRCAQRSCSEVQSQLYVALNQDYLPKDKFQALDELPDLTKHKIGGFIRYLLTAPPPALKPGTTNKEQRTQTP